MATEQLDAALERQRLAHEEAIDAHLGVMEELSGLVGEHAALLLIANALFKKAPLAISEEVLRGMEQNASSNWRGEDDRFRQSFKDVVQYFCDRLPPPLPPPS